MKKYEYARLEPRGHGHKLEIISTDPNMIGNMILHIESSVVGSRKKNFLLEKRYIVVNLIN